MTFGCFPLSGKWQEINVGEGVKKKEPLYTVGNVNDADTMEKGMEVPQKIKNRTTMWSSNSTPGYLSKEYENTNLKRYMPPCIHHFCIHNSQDV